METEKIKLNVAETYHEDARRGIVRIDSSSLAKLGASQGDYLLIKGKNETLGKVYEVRSEDEGLNLIRMDSTIRNNLGVSLGDEVEIKKVQVVEAKSIEIAPTEEVKFTGDPTQIFHEKLMGNAYVKGNMVYFNIMGTTLHYIVTKTNPKKYVRVTANTKVKVLDKVTKPTDMKVPTITYDDIGGLKEEVSAIREMVEIPMKHPEVFERIGITPPKGVLLYGPPGTGKTLLAKALATELDAHFITINGPEIMSKYYGESEKHLREIFEEAEKNSPTIVFIDEIDSIAPNRDNVSGEAERRIVSQLLTLMDGLKGRGNVIVIAATNRPNAIDPALRRPGRFDREININPPTRNARKEILDIHTRGMPLEHWDNEIAAKETLKKLNSLEEEINKKIIAPISEEILSNKENLNKLDLRQESTKEEDLETIKNQIKKISNNIKELFRKKTNAENKKKQIIAFINKIKKDKHLITKSLVILEELNKDCNFRQELKNGFDINKFYIEEDLNTINLDLSKNNDLIIKKYYEYGIFDLKFNETINQKSISKMLEKIAEVTHGFTGADLEVLTKEAAMKALKKYIPDLVKFDEKVPTNVLETIKVKQEHFDEALHKVEPSAMREVLIRKPNVKWEHIGGLDKAKNDLKEMVEMPLKEPEVFKEVGIKAPKGVLLTGPPGTGKTLLAKAVATESEANFISIKGPELISKWVGESEKAVREIFKKAKQVAPTVIFFDEFDSIGSVRGGSINGVNDKVVNQLLTELDGVEELTGVSIIAATNRADLIDDALKRPGRLDSIIEISLPDEKTREEIFKIHTKNMPLDKEVDLKVLAKETKGFSGADIEGLTQMAGLEAIRNRKDTKERPIVKMDYFKSSLKSIKERKKIN